MLVAALSAPGCAKPEKSEAEHGAQLYFRSCGGCHGPDGRGTARPGLTRRPRDLGDPALYRELSDDDLVRVIRAGKGQMPPFERLLTPDELRLIVAHLHTLAREPTR